MVEVKRRDGETFESMLRRFQRKIQQSGVLLRARNIRFFRRKPSRNILREQAIRRSTMRVLREEEWKMTPLSESIHTRRNQR